MSIEELLHNPLGRLERLPEVVDTRSPTADLLILYGALLALDDTTTNPHEKQNIRTQLNILHTMMDEHPHQEEIKTAKKKLNIYENDFQSISESPEGIEKITKLINILSTPKEESIDEKKKEKVKMKKILISVFGGNPKRDKEEFENHVKLLAQELSRYTDQYHIDLYYGGGDYGLVPQFIKKFKDLKPKESKITGITEPRYENEPENLEDARVKARNLSERKDHYNGLKSQDIKNYDEIIALALAGGGLGTLDEITTFIENSRTRGLNQKVLIDNHNDYYQGLKLMLDDAEDNGSIRAEDRAGIIFEENPQELISKLFISN